MKGHWSRTCRMTKHLVDLYQASVKGKGKQIETNFIGGKSQWIMMSISLMVMM